MDPHLEEWAWWGLEVSGMTRVGGEIRVVLAVVHSHLKVKRKASKDRIT